MKKNICSKLILIVILISIISGKNALAETPDKYHLNPTPVEWNRDRPRTQTISYDSEEASKKGSRESSTYLQPLDGEWSTEIVNGDKSFMREYKTPFKWVDRENFLYIGSASGPYSVFVNGELVGYNQSHSTSAEFNITPKSKEGINSLKIIVYSKYAASVIESPKSQTTPTLSDEIYIISQPKVRIRDYTARISFEGNDANFELGVIMKSHLLNEKKYRVFFKLLSPVGGVVAEGYKDAEFSMQSEESVRFFAKVPKVYRWSHKTPRLYTLLLKTQYEGRFGEYIAYQIGMRSVETKQGEMVINSVPTKLHIKKLESGTENYSEFITSLKGGGYNAIKVPHPMPSKFYRMCDEHGVYVINQTDINSSVRGLSRERGGNPSNDPAWENAYVDRAWTMYQTSKNHASVVTFSIAENSSNGYNLYASYQILKQLEENRPIIYLEAEGEWNSDMISVEIANRYPSAVADRATLVVGDRGEEELKPKEPSFELMDEQRGVYKITNNAVMLRLYAELTYGIKQGSKTVAQGKLPIVVDPQSSIEVELPMENVKANVKRKLKYDVSMKSEFR